MNTKNAFGLSGQRALITGGGSGLGLGIAKCMVESGASVVIVGRRESVLRAAVGEIGEATQYRVCDISDLGAIPSLVKEVEAEHGPVDTLVNNAGVHLKKRAVEVSDVEFQTVMQTHVNAAFALSREFGKVMVERGSGSILFTASMASYLGIPLLTAYAAAKTAHLGLVRVLSAEYSPLGVRVNAIAPGWIHSEMMHKAVNADPERKAKILSRTPMNTFGDPEDVGWAAVYLASPAAKFVTGVCLPVDGGASIGF